MDMSVSRTPRRILISVCPCSILLYFELGENSGTNLSLAGVRNLSKAFRHIIRRVTSARILILPNGIKSESSNVTFQLLLLLIFAVDCVTVTLWPNNLLPGSLLSWKLWCFQFEVRFCVRGDDAWEAIALPIVQDGCCTDGKCNWGWRVIQGLGVRG